MLVGALRFRIVEDQGEEDADDEGEGREDIPGDAPALQLSLYRIALHAKRMAIVAPSPLVMIMKRPWAELRVEGSVSLST